MSMRVIARGMDARANRLVSDWCLVVDEQHGGLTGYVRVDDKNGNRCQKDG